MPLLRRDIRPSLSDVEHWTDDLVREIRARLGIVLPLAENEIEFLELLNGQGVIEPTLLTSDAAMQQRIDTCPGLRWKALNVRKHVGGG
jgi:hypothetical protein